MQTDPPQATHTAFHKGISWYPGQWYLVTLAVTQREDDHHMSRLCNIPVLLTELLVNQRLEESRRWSLQLDGSLISTMNAPDEKRSTEDCSLPPAGLGHSATLTSGRISNFLTLCRQHTTQVSIWLCMCERVCERVSGWQASQYPSSRVCVKGCDLLGKEDSGSGPCQTDYPPPPHPEPRRSLSMRSFSVPLPGFALSVCKHQFSLQHTSTPQETGD